MSTPTLRIQDVLAASFAWTSRLVGSSPLFRRCRNPTRAANAKLIRLEEAGDMHSASVLAIEPEQATLLHIHHRGESLPAGKLAANGERFYSQSAGQITVWFPSDNFARRYGSWTGSQELKSEQANKINHALLVSATWLALLERNPQEALTKWTPERQVELEAQKRRLSGSVPDGVISGHTAVECVGRYPKRFVEKKTKSLERQFRRIEFWGCKGAHQ